MRNIIPIVLIAATVLAQMNAPAPAPFVPSPVPPKVGLKGAVFVRGVPPAERVITFDSLCGPLQNGPVLTRHYVVSSHGALATRMPPVLLDTISESM